MGSPVRLIGIALVVALVGATLFKVYERVVAGTGAPASAPAGGAGPGAGAGGGARGAGGRPDGAAAGAGPGGGGPGGGPGGGGRAGAGAAALVSVAAASEQEIVDAIEALGTTLANESVTITGKVTESVHAVNFEDGALVKAGDVLVELTNQEETAQLAEARANLSDAERQSKRLEDLAAQGSAPVSQRDEARARVEGARARLDAIVARLDDRLIRAPFTGVLGFRRVSPGTLITPNTEVTTIDDIATVKLDFTVPEVFLGSLRPGLEVEATAAAWPGRAFRGEVITLDSRVDPATRAITVRARLPNADLALRPGMLMTVRLVQSRGMAIVVPESALLQLQQQRFVYTVADGRAQRIDVEIGRRRPGIVEITSGLAAGMPVIVEGADRVRPNAPVQVAAAGGRRGNAGPGGPGGGRRPGAAGAPGAPAAATPASPAPATGGRTATGVSS
jgi:membrane fusion protein (multidrug efflux system)